MFKQHLAMQKVALNALKQALLKALCLKKWLYQCENFINAG
jgi:hypothetical protein